jgi:hypothetical protein
MLKSPPSVTKILMKKYFNKISFLRYIYGDKNRSNCQEKSLAPKIAFKIEE